MHLHIHTETRYTCELYLFPLICHIVLWSLTKNTFLNIYIPQNVIHVTNNSNKNSLVSCSSPLWHEYLTSRKWLMYFVNFCRFTVCTFTVCQQETMPALTCSFDFGFTSHLMNPLSSCHKISIELRSGDSRGVFHGVFRHPIFGIIRHVSDHYLA